ncbi:MAG: hypothetical protein IJC48_11565 [Clostridia bacterium]|nr:hypothetical protein [Clostridia bacterium]
MATVVTANIQKNSLCGETYSKMSKVCAAISGDLLYDYFIWFNYLPGARETVTGYAGVFFAGACGALAAMKRGSLLSLPAKEDNEKFLKNIRRLTIKSQAPGSSFGKFSFTQPRRP